MSKENDVAIKIKRLTKSYDLGKTFAVADISFEVEKSSLFAFLGMNGAGKSTTINIICSILDKDSGEIFINGHNLDKESDIIKNEIGVVYQNSVLDDFLTVKENLEIRSSFYGLAKKERKDNLNEIVRLLEIEPLLNKPVNTLSGGQKRKIDIARAMIHKPKLLILDEPTTGLDPKTRLMVWGLIDKIRKETGMSVFLTTHYLEEAELASKVVIMNKGKIIACGTPNELKNSYAKDYILSYEEFDEEFSKNLADLNYFSKFDEEKHAFKIEVKDTNDVKFLLEKFKNHFKDIEVIKGKLDDVFLKITGNKIDENDNHERV